MSDHSCPRSLAILCLSAALVAGCSAGGSGGSGGGKPVTLTMYTGGTGALANNFNPYSPTANVATQGMIYEPLMFFNLGRANDVRPLLATKYEWSADGKAVTFTLRGDVTWSDGQKFTAQDVAFTMNLLKAHKALNIAGLPLAEITVGDSTHVTVGFTRPAYTDLWYVAGQTWIVPEHNWKSISDPATYTDPRPVGTGPFTLDKFSPQNFTLKKNEHYWQQGKPEVGGIRFIALSNNAAALSALQSGQVDWQSAFIPKIDQVWGKTGAGHEWINTPLSQTTLMANLEKFPTNDKAVRQAIYYGVDREQLNNVAFDNQASETNCGLVLQPRDLTWLAPDLPNLTPTHDPAKAQQILEADGWRRGGDGIYAKDGTRLSLVVKVITGYSDYIAALQAMTQQLRTVGIEIRTQQISYAAFTADRNTGKYDLVMDAVYGGPTPYYLYNNFLNSVNTAPIGQQANPNYARFRDPAVDRALATVAGTNDQATQKAAYATIQRTICDQMPYIPLITNSTLTEYRTDKVTGFPTKDDLYAIPAVYLRPDLAVVATSLKVR